MELPDNTAESCQLSILLCLASKILSRTYKKDVNVSSSKNYGNYFLGKQ